MSTIAGLGCSFVLNILHLLFSFYLQLKLLKSIFSKLVYNANYIFIDKNRKFQIDSELITKHIRNYSKIPKHLTFALGNEKICYDELVQIIVWTLPAGIPVLSFYDHKNELNADKLYNAFCKYHVHLLSRIKWGVSFSEKHQQLADNDSPYSLQVNVLNANHGRQLLIDSIKELCQNYEVTPKDRATTEAVLDDIMSSKLSNCSNPDFMVINGYVYTTYGLSPWHLTFTEFLTIPSYRLLRTKDYVGILAKFANCEQNFGR